MFPNQFPACTTFLWIPPYGLHDLPCPTKPSTALSPLPSTLVSKSTLACHASCTCPAFDVVRLPQDDVIPADSSPSSQSLPLHVDNAVNNTELLTSSIGENLRYFQGQAVFFRMSSQPALFHGTLRCIRNNPSPFQNATFTWFIGAARPGPKVFPSTTAN